MSDAPDTDMTFTVLTVAGTLTEDVALEMAEAIDADMDKALTSNRWLLSLLYAALEFDGLPVGPVTAMLLQELSAHTGIEAWELQ